MAVAYEVYFCSPLIWIRTMILMNVLLECKFYRKILGKFFFFFFFVVCLFRAALAHMEVPRPRVESEL